MKIPENPHTQTVYGPVKSWRFGRSLGIDPIFQTSTCSFNCIYCQLGKIQQITTEIKDYVSTAQVIEDFLAVRQEFEVITYSGSGEPTLAKNLGEIIAQIKKMAPQYPQLVLTNATMLSNPRVQENLLTLDRVIVKVDAGNEQVFQKINRPAPGITLEATVAGILAFKKIYSGILEVQSMFMPTNYHDITEYAQILSTIAPHVVQLNTPKRPYPLSWHRENRGNHQLEFAYEVRSLQQISPGEAFSLEKELVALTGLKFVSVYSAI